MDDIGCEVNQEYVVLLVTILSETKCTFTQDLSLKRMRVRSKLNEDQ